jgi:ketosteroid isomerase-like protein
MATKRRRGGLLLPLACLLLLAASPATAVAGTATGRDWSELVAAERAFAQASVERGMRTAFLEVLAEDSIVFRPHAVDARSWFEERPEAEGTLAWKPIVAEVSADGTLGYTSGPWTFTATDGTRAYGHYVSIWRRRADGSWRLLVDLGVSHEDPDEVADEVARPERDPPPDAAEADTLVPELRRTDEAFAELASRKGAVRAYRKLSAGDLRLYRAGTLPATDRRSVRALLRQQPARSSWEVSDAAAAGSGDLGYTLGTTSVPGEDGDAGRNSYVRLWHRGRSGDWRLILDVMVPLR